MASPGKPPSPARDLRQQAEAQMQGQAAAAAEAEKSLSPAAREGLLHELRVHQIELELQNEELRRAQGELEASQARYFDLYDLAPVGYVTVSERGLILEANLTAATLLGETRQALVQQPFSRFIPKEGQDTYYRLRQQLFGTGLPQACDLQLITQDGRTFWGHLAATLAEDAHDAPVSRIVLSDMTERKRAEEALRASEAGLRAILNASPDGIVVADLEGILRQVSPAALPLFGCEWEEELLGLLLTELIAPQEQERLAVQIAFILQGRLPGPSVYLGRRSDGGGFALEVNGEFIPGVDGRPVRLVFILRDITQRQEAEAKAQASGERHRVIVQTAMDGFWVTDPHGRFLEVNEAYCRMSGYSAQELLTMQVTDLEAAETAADTTAHIKKIMTQGQDRFESRQRCKNGDIMDVEVSVQYQAEEGRMVAFLRDITERKRAERALLNSEARFHDLVNSSDGIVWEADATTFAFTSVSGNAERMLGYQASEWLQAGFWASHIHPDDRDHAIQYCVACTGRLEDHDFEYRFLAQDGSVVWLRDIVKVVEEGGRPRWLRGLMVDITHQKQVEEEQATLTAQLHQVQKMENLGSLAGGVAHDMNNVLGAILGLASANIDMQTPGSPTQKAFAIIIKAAERGGKMVRSLLTFARQSPAEALLLDLNVVLQEEVSLLEKTTLAKIHLVLDLDTELRLMRGDANALTHALMNLCVNAMDAMDGMPENGILTLRTRNVDQDWLEVVVEDTGPGMPKEILAKAMDPFFTTKELGKGTGLGLSIVYRTVMAHQGQMELLSAPGQGTQVRLRFPTCAEGPTGPTTDRTLQVLDPLLALQVLLVDDDELIQGSLQTILELLGHSVTTARSGEEALAKLEAGLEPELVILDMNMPGLGGSGTLPRLRALRPQVPVLLSTGRVDQTAVELAAAYPGVILLPKPFSMKELQEHLAAFRRD